MKRMASARKSSNARRTSTRPREPRAAGRQFAVCVDNDGYEASLERNKIYVVLFDEDAERDGRESLEEALRKRGIPMQKLSGSPLLADVIREMGFKKADDFYIALGAAKVSPKVVVNKVMQRLKQGEAGGQGPPAGEGPGRERGEIQGSGQIHAARITTAIIPTMDG